MREIMTPSKEDYLKNILELNGADAVVSNKALAQALDVSAASVTEMNNRLVKENLIDYLPYKGVTLTPQGLKIARLLVRKHRIWEVFLSSCLGYDWEYVHEEADRLEHVSSDELIDRLDAFLGHPRFDPHGAIIPDRNGEIPDFGDRLTLDHFQVGDHFQLVELKDDPEILYYIQHKGLRLGQSYELVAREPFQGPLQLRDADGKDYYLSYQVAEITYGKKIN